VISASVACRVDLAGGTLDIWPIGLLHPGARTVNLAVTVRATATLSPLARGFVVRQGGHRVEGSSPAELRRDADAGLAALVAELHQLPPVEVGLATESPRGGGLGGSSALTVALLAAAERFSGRAPERTPTQRARVARDLEAQLLGLPTGLQDHLPGQLGGVLSIEHRVGGEAIRRIDVDLEALGDRLLVGFTGESHFSAGANWAILRRRFDGERDVVARLDRVAEVAERVEAALVEGDFEAAGRWVDEEWTARSGLAAEVTTPRVEALLGAARDLGAWGGKACGAGGGGSLAVLVAPERREAIERAWREAGVEVLAARPTAAGLEVREE